MKVKHQLQQIEKLDLTIQQKLSELESARAMAEKITVAPDGDRVSGSRLINDKMAEYAVQIAQMEEELVNRIVHFIRFRTRVVGRIEMLDSVLYRQILFMHYVEYKSLADIAYELSYSEDYIRHAHGNALQAYEDLINFKEKIWISEEDDTK